MYLAPLCATLIFFAAISIACNESDGDDDSLLSGALAVLSQNLPSSSTTSPIYMFSDSNNNLGLNANRGGRSGLDALCTARKDAAYASLSCTNIRAWITVSSSDSIALMPVTYSVPITTQVLGPTGTQIAENWAGLLDGTVSDAGSLKAAGLFGEIGADAYYWVGSNANEGTVADTCTNWTINVGTGHILNETTNNGFATSITQNCNNSSVIAAGSISIVCLCF